MREEIGIAETHERLRKAMAGLPGYFFAMENHMTFGTLDTETTSVINWPDDGGRCFRSDPQWMTDAIEFVLTLGIEIKRGDQTDPDEARAVATQLKAILKEVKHG